MIKKIFYLASISIFVTLTSTAGIVFGGNLSNAEDNSEIFNTRDNDPYTLAVQAYVWGYPLVRAAEIRTKTTSIASSGINHAPDIPAAPLNQMGHQRALSTPNTRLGVAPNHDTLYSLAWLDLAEEPFVLQTPDFGDRYYVFQMGQADSSTDRSFGYRSHGANLPPIFIYYDDYFKGEVPDGMIGVKSQNRHLMIAGRIFVKDELDMASVHNLQDQIILKPYSEYIAPSEFKRASHAEYHQVKSTDEHDDLKFMHQLGEILKYWNPLPGEIELIESFRKIGLSQENGFLKESLTDQERELIEKGITDGQKIVRSKTFKLGHEINGWSVNYLGSHFGQDYLLRAAVALDQIYVLEPEESLYPSARVDANGETLDGRHLYSIKFEKNEIPPVNAFWSITLYYASGFMVPNEINRWSISNRTPNLFYESDGSLKIIIHHKRPSDPYAANWLPAPEGPFMLLMRLYNPKNEVLTKEWVPPPIERLKIHSAD